MKKYCHRLKQEKKPYVKAGAVFIELRDEIGTSEGEFLQVTPYFLIKTSDEGYSMFSPTPCDVLAEDWVIVEA